MSHTLRIESAQNEFFKMLCTLKSSAGIKKNKLFFLMGENLIREFLNEPKFEIVSEIIHPNLKPVTKAPTKRTELSERLFQEVDFLGTHFNLLLLKLNEIPIIDSLPPKKNGFDLLSPVGDPSNLGALIRSAEAFNIEEIFLTQDSAFPFHPKAVKASAGSVLRSSFLRLSQTITTAPSGSVGLDLNHTPISEYLPSPYTILVVGEEGQGLNIPVQKKITIPTSKVESLNATVAASIALYEISNRISRFSQKTRK